MLWSQRVTHGLARGWQREFALQRAAGLGCRAARAVSTARIPVKPATKQEITLAVSRVLQSEVFRAKLSQTYGCQLPASDVHLQLLAREMRKKVFLPPGLVLKICRDEVMDLEGDELKLLHSRILPHVLTSSYRAQPQTPCLVPEAYADDDENVELDYTILAPNMQKPESEPAKRDPDRIGDAGRSSDDWNWARFGAPHLWYSLARQVGPRKITMHVGPTNSGKTYHALKELMAAPSGVYCGPLRLLAWEIHEKLCAEGVPCDLLTGQERVRHEGAMHTACTIEMASTGERIDCAVIDEAQMIAHEERGWAWTRAFLGLPAKQIHLCGDESFVPLCTELAELCGDVVEVRRYTRLTPLHIAKYPISPELRTVKPGDCVIGFSRRQVYELKRKIEQGAKYKCAVIYGSLPPETRKEQARLFNLAASQPTLPDAMAVMVATDAIGMGLNLAIRRVIFTTLAKFDGTELRALTPSEMRQIGGRAGRHGGAYELGEVVCTNRKEQRFLAEQMSMPLEPALKAGLAPTLEMVSAWTHSREGSTLEMMFEAFEHAQQGYHFGERYFSCDLGNMKDIAALLAGVRLPLDTRFMFCMAPVSVDDEQCMASCLRFAEALQSTGHVALPDSIHDCLVHVPRSPVQLLQLESAYRVLDLYLWLALRFEGSFDDTIKAEQLQRTAAALIDEALMIISAKGMQQPRNGSFASMVTSWRKGRFR